MIGSLMTCMSVIIFAGRHHDWYPTELHARTGPCPSQPGRGVLLVLFGLYYRMVPAAGTTTLAKVQGWLHMVGAILFPAGIAVVLLKGPSFEAAPVAGSLLVVTAMALFVVIVFRSARA